MRPQNCLHPIILLILSPFLFNGTTAAPPASIHPHWSRPTATNRNEALPALIPRSLSPSTATATLYPLPDPNAFPLQFALDSGWSVIVHDNSYIYPLSRSTGIIEHFFTYIQAYALARMLQGFSNPCRARFRRGDLVLALQMHPRSTVGTVEWSVVYAFARYMARWVERGFSGHGGLLFRHRSGILLGAVLLNHDSVGTPENTVDSDQCPY